ncbi:MAG: PRC-barrel domain-containing protein [Rhodobacteraceae bacterium]|nr:PRC-barrel domain-containing protein [Paracoccaceae bacterium]
MHKLFAATTALALVLGAPLAAETVATSGFAYKPSGEEIRASDFIGTRVYVTDTDMSATTDSSANADMPAKTDGTMPDSTTAAADPKAGRTDIGEIGDILMSKDGEIDAIIVDVGGFLGIGEKQVAVSMDKLKFVSDGSDPEDYFVVFTASRSALENAPPYEPDTHADAAGTSNAPEGTLGTQTLSDDEPQTAASGGAAVAPAVGTAPSSTDHDGYSSIERASVSTDELKDAPVYDAEDKHIGEVSELIAGPDGKIQNAVLEVGGFLGLGEKKIEVKYDALDIRKETDGDDLRVYIDATKEGLMNMPQYEG